MGLYTGIALDGQKLTNPVIYGGSITNTNLEAGVMKFDGLTSLYGGFDTYMATVTVANGATTGKEAAIGMPTNFLPIAMALNVTVAATNAVTLVDVGDDVDTDAYIDGATTPSLATTGFKGVFGCNGARALGDITNGVTGALTTADEVEVVISGDPGATGVTMQLTFFGVRVSTSDFS
jgi:hypothetical protein